MPSQQFMAATGTAVKDLTVATIASALADVDINIFGADIHPFGFLRGWATDLTNQANQAIADAATASASAATAQAHSNAVATAVTTGTGNTPSTAPADVQTAVAQTTADANAAAAAAAANEANLIASTASTTLTLATKADIATIPHNVPSWFSLNPLEDVSYPRSEIIQGYAVLISGGSFAGSSTTTLTDSGGHVAGVWYATNRTEPSFAPASGALQIVYINATRNRIYNTVGLVAKTNGGTPAAMYVGISKMDLTAGVPNGNITRLYTSANISGSITSALSDIRDNLSFDIVATQGDWFAVEILQVATGGQTLSSVACKVGVAITAPAGYNPAKPVMTLAGQSAIPSSVTKAAMDQSSVTMPWVCLGQQTAVTKADYVDLFDRANSGVLGANWAPYGGTSIGVASNTAHVAYLGQPGYNGYDDQTAIALYTSQLTTDTQAVAATYGASDPLTRHLTTPIATWLILRSNSAASAFVGVAIYPTSIVIATPSGALATVSNTNNSGDVVDFHAVANVFTVYVNGVAKLTYTDSSNVLPLGASYRFCGLAMRTQAYGGSLISSPEWMASANLLQWEAKDL